MNEKYKLACFSLSLKYALSFQFQQLPGNVELISATAAAAFIARLCLRAYRAFNLKIIAWASGCLPSIVDRR